MPTNILRNAHAGRHTAAARPRAAPNSIAVLTIGKARIRLRLADTDTAARVWAALPIHSTAETWGSAIHFETPVDSGRDRTARTNGVAGEVYFWAEDGRILLPWGPTPISRPNEIRLPRPCNVWATALDDPAVFARVTPGEKVSLVAEPKIREAGNG